MQPLRVGKKWTAAHVPPAVTAVQRARSPLRQSPLDDAFAQPARAAARPVKFTAGSFRSPAKPRHIRLFASRARAPF